MSRITAITLLLTLALGGCATAPLVDRSAVDLELAPQQVAEQPGDPSGTVNWGGRIIDVRSVDEHTELEILSYPLSSSGRPDTERASNGRFIAVHAGFVDPLVYGTGRTVTLVGTLTGYRDGSIGTQAYRWPVVSVRQIAPAPERRREPVTPFFSIGVGIGL